jgi:hypothetical protein
LHQLLISHRHATCPTNCIIYLTENISTNKRNVNIFPMRSCLQQWESLNYMPNF